MTALIIILIIVILGFCTTVWIAVVLFYTKVPFVKMPKQHIETLLHNIHISDSDIVYDLGCGDAHVLIEIAKHSGARTVGFDISPIAYLKARWNIWRNKSTTKVFFKDFRKADISDANIIFIFLIVGVMNTTWKFLVSHTQPGTKIISYGFTFPGVTPEQVIPTSDDQRRSKLTVYTIPQS